MTGSPIPSAQPLVPARHADHLQQQVYQHAPHMLYSQYLEAQTDSTVSPTAHQIQDQTLLRGNRQAGRPAYPQHTRVPSELPQVPFQAGHITSSPARDHISRPPPHLDAVRISKNWDSTAGLIIELSIPFTRIEYQYMQEQEQRHRDNSEKLLQGLSSVLLHSPGYCNLALPWPTMNLVSCCSLTSVDRSKKLIADVGICLSLYGMSLGM